MATEETTDRHDESDSAQFGEERGIEGTPFEESACADCGTYVVKVPGYPDPRCIECARTKAGIDWPSGHPLGAITPVISFATRRETLHTTPTTTAESDWAWVCIYCLQRGTALNADHAATMHQQHIAYSCPSIPGLNEHDMRLRTARRQAFTDLYPADVPQIVLTEVNGKLKAQPETQ